MLIRQALGIEIDDIYKFNVGNMIMAIPIIQKDLSVWAQMQRHSLI